MTTGGTAATRNRSKKLSARFQKLG